MPAKLIDQTSGRSFDLRDVTKLGRSRSCDIQLADPRVSRQHAMIRLEDGAYWFYDLGSFNGSTINQRRVLSGQRLRHDDEIEIAGFRLSFLQPTSSKDPTVQTVSPESMQTVALVRTSPAIVLVSDIKGFTGMSEDLAPEIIARRLGRWYASCEQVINEGGGGTIDKFIGDAVLAHWMNPADTTHSKAVAAADQLVRNPGSIDGPGENDSRTTNTTILECCAALHSGDVAYGGMGGGELTLLGDTVNVAFRIQELTREFDRPILASDDFLKAGFGGNIPEDWESLGEREIKGRRTPVGLYAPRWL